MTGALFELRGGRQTAMFVLGAINFALGTLILFFRPAQQCAPAVRAHCMLTCHTGATSHGVNAGALQHSSCLAFGPGVSALMVACSRDAALK